MAKYRFVVASAVAGLAFVIGCSPKTGSSGTNGNAAGSAGGAGSRGDSGAGADNGLGAGLAPGDGVFGTDPLHDAGGGAPHDASCAALVLEPEAITVEKVTPLEINCTSEAPQPINIYIMLDNSGSMRDANKWNDAKAALTTFVQSDPSLHGKPWTCTDKDGNSVAPPSTLAPPGAGSISVAIQYFHPQGVGNPDECNGTGHATPAVPMGPIPANGPPIVTSLGQTGPSSNTPTVGALTGGTEYCAAYQQAHPGEKCVLVLVTDGQPNGCGLSSSCGGILGGSDCVDPASAGVLTPIAQTAFSSSGVITFTVGMNGVNADGFALLNQVAIAGGSDCSPGVPGNETCNITTGGSQAFLDALNTIRQTVQVTSASSTSITTSVTEKSTLQCEWAIPQPTDGQTFHKELVNVTFEAGGTTEHLGNVATVADCAATGGWYYDDPNAPTRIISCPGTCGAIQSAADGKVSVLVGCATEPAIVR